MIFNERSSHINKHNLLALLASLLASPPAPTTANHLGSWVHVVPVDHNALQQKRDKALYKRFKIDAYLKREAIKQEMAQKAVRVARAAAYTKKKTKNKNKLKNETKQEYPTIVQHSINTYANMPPNTAMPLPQIKKQPHPANHMKVTQMLITAQNYKRLKELMNSPSAAVGKKIDQMTQKSIKYIDPNGNVNTLYCRGTCTM